MPPTAFHALVDAGTSEHPADRSELTIATALTMSALAIALCNDDGLHGVCSAASRATRSRPL